MNTTNCPVASPGHGPLLPALKLLKFLIASFSMCLHKTSCGHAHVHKGHVAYKNHHIDETHTREERSMTGGGNGAISGVHMCIALVLRIPKM